MLAFQSTRPVWGATRRLSTSATMHTDFNPRAPCGARRQAPAGAERSLHISIHAPRVGRDRLGGDRRAPKRISIHAPRVGRDVLHKRKKTVYPDFNPRAPCGARRLSGLIFRKSYLFQSTRPVWGATISPACIYSKHGISIHAPRVGRDTGSATNCVCIKKFQSTRPVWGATPIATRFAGANANFNPRAPCGARQCRKCRICRFVKISIHAPRVGRDASEAYKSNRTLISIHAPRVGRDEEYINQICDYNISIHAPRVGRDRRNSDRCLTQAQFQSTRPVWGATGQVGCAD